MLTAVRSNPAHACLPSVVAAASLAPLAYADFIADSGAPLQTQKLVSNHYFHGDTLGFGLDSMGMLRVEPQLHEVATPCSAPSLPAMPMKAL